MAQDREPKSWSELLNTYRDTTGSRSYCTAAAVGPQVRFTRSVPAVCPLAELKHPLYATGSLHHCINAKDGSLQRAQWHGWGDVSLLKEEGYQGKPHPHGVPNAAEGKRIVAAPVAKDGRKGLFGLLQGTETGPDAWLGNLQIDPSKGKRAVSAPGDEQRSVSFTQLLAHTAPGRPAEDAWLGNISIDPSKGKGHAADPSSLRGRGDLFAIMQQKALQHNGSSNGLSDSSQSAAEADAWIGHRLIQPNKGKKPVDLPDESQDHLFASTFKDGPAPDGCWCDMPPVGKRPLEPPSNASNFINAAQTMRILDPVPPGTVVGFGKPQSKGMVADPYHSSSKPEHVDIYKLMTFQPLSGAETSRYQHAWNDAPVQPKRKHVSGAAAASSDNKQLEWRPNKAMRYVPFGGIAQEAGMTLDMMLTNRKQFQRDFGQSTCSGKAAQHAGQSMGSSKSGSLAAATSIAGGKATSNR